MRGVTFDTGALIALERRKQRMRDAWQRLLEAGWRITVPADAVAEWWRGRSELRVNILARLQIEPVTVALATIAGEAMAAVPGATVVDAIVMASAAQRGDVVYTSDVDDLERLRQYFPSVRLLGV